MIDQEDERRQLEIEVKITKEFQVLYNLLLASDLPEAEEALGHVAEAKAIWEKDTGSIDLEDFK